MGEISRASPGRAGAEAPRKPPAFSRRPSGERPLCRPLSGAAPPRGGAAAEPERAWDLGNDVNRETNPRSALREAVTEQQQHQHHHHTRPIESNSSSVCS
ncbi:unnamed protein product [Lampetra planeri]